MEKPAFLNELNAPQREAVEYIDGPSLVIAGAGSGKTRVLTYKIAYLLTAGINPWEIMALTFTNKAAKEMKERIASLVGGNTARYLRMGTFHSVFAQILRSEAGNIGYSSNFTIYDESDSRSLCKAIIKELGLDDKVYKPSDVHNRISWAKNKLMLPEQYEADNRMTASDAQAKRPQIALIYRLYCQRCHQSNAMDFDDLLLNTFLLFKGHPETRLKYATNFRFFLVDEYQDTNYAQQKIIHQLASEHKHVCVVGDDAQSIYAFRGANIDNILDFQEQYSGAKLFKLEQNYRSTQCIVNAANSLIRHNERQIRKDVFSRNAEGEKLQLRELASDREEALYICNDIKRLLRNKEAATHGDFAILYRANYQSRPFEEQMIKIGMPYRIYGGMSFYQRKEIKDVVAYFRMVANPDDDEAFRRIINYPARGIGDTTVQKIYDAARACGTTMWQVVCEPERTSLNVNKGTLAKIAAFRGLIESFMERLITDDAFTLGKDIIKLSGITADIYKGTDAEDLSRQENLEEFLSSIQEFVQLQQEQGEPTGLVDFLHDVALLSDRQEGDEDTPKVTLMTVHSAKGLEFPCVYVVGMEENVFPSPLSTESKRQLEEERRLLYVAITRAEKRCTLTYARSRYRYGRMEFDVPSRFLKDIDSSLVDFDGATDSAPFASYGTERKNLFGSMPRYGTTKQSRAFSGESKAAMQNSRPVASQFMADPKPRVTEPRRPQQAVNPFSPAFERTLKASGANMSRIDSAMRNGGRASAAGFNSPTPSDGAPQQICRRPSQDLPKTISKRQRRENDSGEKSLAVGDAVRHDRFGEGIIKELSGSGDSTKATVEFRNAGTKQLLLKFAKLKKL